MIESVQVRQRGAFDFETHYDNLCALQDSCPMSAVKAHLSQGVLDLNGDRVRAADWVPVLNTLRINKSLEFIAFRSFYTPPTNENEKNLAIHRKKMPAIRSKEITYRLCKALRECLTISPSLTCLELQGLPMRDRDLTSLTKGLFKSTALSHLSLEYCRIGDNGLDIICRGIKNSTTINSINLTGCSLTWKGADCLAKVIKHQAMRRHSEAWRDSLRYRRPDLDRMPGIRRITINNNPMLSDQGAILLAEALKDDLWLKALDLQACGISSSGARALLDVLKYNTTIVVLDVRRNPLIDRDVLHSIMEQLMLNCNGQDTEYKWIKAEEPADQSKPNLKGPVRKRRTKTLNISFGRKATIRVPVSSARRRTKSAGAAGGGAGRNQGNVAEATGLPWRTAARANRHRGFPPEHALQSSSMYEASDLDSPTGSPNHGASIIVTREDSAAEDTFGVLGKFDLDESNHNAEIKNVRGVRVELEQLRRRLREEADARKSAEQRTMELALENKRLKGELMDLRTTRGSILDDDQVLESIEASFKQFHSFLDLLRDAGLGQLITIAGLDQGTMPFGQGTPSAFPPKLGQNGTSSLQAQYPSNSGPRVPVQKPFSRQLYAGDIHSAGQVSTSYGSYEEGQPILFGPQTADNSARHRPEHANGLLSMHNKYGDIPDPTMQSGLDESYKADDEAMTADDLYERLVLDTRTVLNTDWDAKIPAKAKTAKSKKVHNEDSDERSDGRSRRRNEGSGSKQTHGEPPRAETVPPPNEDRLNDVHSSEQGKEDDKGDNSTPGDIGEVEKGGNTGRDLADRDTPDLRSLHSEANYSMDGFEPSYVSERGEVVHLGDDLDLLGSPSPPGQKDSEDEDF